MEQEQEAREDQARPGRYPARSLEGLDCRPVVRLERLDRRRYRTRGQRRGSGRCADPAQGRPRVRVGLGDARLIDQRRVEGKLLP